MRYLLLFLFTLSASAQAWRPTDGRMTSWINGQTVGVFGGIPTNYTQWCDATVSIPGYGGAVMSTNASGVDNAAALQFAWDNCPSNQFVYIGVPGTYQMGAKITQKTTSIDPENNHVLIKGHPGMVELYWNPASSINRGWQIGSSKWGNATFKDYTTLGEFLNTNLPTGTYTYTMTTGTPATKGFVKGAGIWIEATNDFTYVTAYGNGSASVNTAYDRMTEGMRSRVHLAWITNISGSTISFTPPVPEPFTTAQEGWIGAFTEKKSDDTIVGVYQGFENLRFNCNTNQVTTFIFNVQSGINCWWKNCEFVGGNSGQFQGTTMLLNTIQSCYFYSNQFATVGKGYSIDLRACGASVVEDTIIRDAYIPIITGCSSMMVYSHNFIYGVRTQGGSGAQGGWINVNHGPHNMFALVEGNIGGRVHGDFNQGSGYKFTVFRHTDSTNDTSSTENRSVIRFDRRSVSNTVAASVLGDPSKTWFYALTNDNYSRLSNNVYQLGFPAIGSNDYTDPPAGGTLSTPRNDYDPEVATSIYRHGNFTEPSETIEWEASNPYRTFEPSLYYSAAPSWWDTTKCPWPSVGSDLPAGAEPWNPAKLRAYGLTTHPQLSLWFSGISNQLLPVP